MRIDVACDRMRVISDLHIGNPFSLAGRRLRDFFHDCREGGWDLAINGDGFEILQASFPALASHGSTILAQLASLIDGGCSVYYVIGNHDIALEHLIENSQAAVIAPFLNVTSGDLRVRVEHGHLYDPMFVRNPDLYELLTRAAGPLLHLYPDVYRLWSRYQGLKDRWLRRRARADTDASVYYEAAERILMRGFDAVVFGHTHKPEVVPIGTRGVYLNTGTWMTGTPTFVEIDGGDVALRRWAPEASPAAL